MAGHVERNRGMIQIASHVSALRGTGTQHLSFRLSFHPALHDLTGTAQLDGLPDLSC